MAGVVVVVPEQPVGLAARADGVCGGGVGGGEVVAVVDRLPLPLRWQLWCYSSRKSQGRRWKWLELPWRCLSIAYRP